MSDNTGKEKQMGKKYKIALSYAHKDQKIADMLGEQLELIFANGFFMDEYRPEELSRAELFREKLKDIFRKSDYAIILYSKHYHEGEFASVEKKQILEKKDMEHCFIINIDDCEVIDEGLKGLTYIPLKIKEASDGSDGSETGKQEKIQKMIDDIVQNKIKKTMIFQTVEEMKNQQEYRLRVQTMCPQGNVFQWDMDYDWNILGKAFIDTSDGRRLKEEFSWQRFWQYIDSDFMWIKRNLSSLPDVKRRIYFNCHLSVAYKLGQVYGDLRQASGNRNLVLISSNRNENIEFEFKHEESKGQIEDFCVEYTGNCRESADIACIISIKPNEQGNVLETVKHYLNKQGKKCSKIYLFQKKITLEDAGMLENIAAYLREKMIACRTGSECSIHLFPDTAAPFMFTLGARSVFPGTVQLYEFIQKNNTYMESLTN